MEEKQRFTYLLSTVKGLERYCEDEAREVCSTVISTHIQPGKLTLTTAAPAPEVLRMKSVDRVSAWLFADELDITGQQLTKQEALANIKAAVANRFDFACALRTWR